MRATTSRAVEAVQPRTTWPQRCGVLAGAAIAILVVLQIAAWAAVTDPYTVGTTGFDISYPNCSSALPVGDSFAVVGVGGGRPFTANSCVGSEWTEAQTATGTAPSLYLNTGYAGAYSRNIDAPCTTAVSSALASGVFSGLGKHALSQAEQAWEIGCSEVDYANTVKPNVPAMWWADVETGNSWSTNASLNDYTIDGISYQMGVLGGGGIYSTSTMLASITGSPTWEPTPAATAHWVSAGSCTTTFGTASTWLSQSPTISGADSDTAC
jgi:hypothetical protein